MKSEIASKQSNLLVSNAILNAEDEAKVMLDSFHPAYARPSGDIEVKLGDPSGVTSNGCAYSCRRIDFENNDNF